MRSPSPSPCLWLRAGSRRAVVERHLEHVAGVFAAAGWQVARGLQPPAVDGAVAVVDDPWVEPLPEIAEALVAAPAPAGVWRIPRVSGLAGEQGWTPPPGLATLRGYRRLQRPRRRPTPAVKLAAASPWTGLAAARAGDARELLAAGWPPGPGDVVLVPGARLYRYADPADHERRELDRFLPESARWIVDVGCGHGHLGARHRRAGRRVIGVEPDPVLALRASRRLDLVLPLPADAAFAALAPPIDCFVFADVLEHTADPASLLRRSAELLSPAGRIVVSIPNSAWAPLLFDLAAGEWEPTLAGVQARDHLVPFTAASFTRLVEECGLRVERALPLPAPLSFRLRLWAWFAARTAGGDPLALAAPQWVFVLCRR